MLRFENLDKRYGDNVLFSGLSRQFDAGCVALQGPNGNGKSTLINILAGVTQADRGEVWIAGHSLSHAVSSAKAQLAYVPDDCMTYPSLTGRGLFERVASEKKTGVEHPTFDLAERLGLTSRLDARFEQMSLGTRKKMFVAALSIGAADVIVADEPSNGLDASARRVLAAWFKELGKDRVVFFSTHDPAFADACDALVVDFQALRGSSAAD